jgi:hypothetical protein
MKFYTVETAPNKRIRYYAERGLLAYLFHELRDDPVPMLEAAKSRDGARWQAPSTLASFAATWFTRSSTLAPRGLAVLMVACS